MSHDNLGPSFSASYLSEKLWFHPPALQAGEVLSRQPNRFPLSRCCTVFHDLSIEEKQKPPLLF
jgi:hypothetical protein